MDREFLGRHRSVNSVSVGLGLSLPVHRSQSTTLVLHVPLHLPTDRDDLPNMAGACPSMAYDLASVCLRTLTNKLLRY
jgi:hypothetical protein